MNATDSGVYVDRTVVYISLPDKETDFVHPEKIVLLCKNNRSIDLGQFCFLDRKSNAPYVSKVDPSSLCKQRIPVVSKLIEAFRASTSRERTLLRRYHSIRQFLNHIDSHGSHKIHEAQDSEYYLRWLDDYIGYLRRRTKLMPTNPQSLKQNSAYSCQLGVIWLLDVVFDLSANDVRSRVNLFVRKNANQPKRSIQREQFKTTTQAHLLIFKQLSEFLMSNNNLPIRLNLSKFGYGESDIYSSGQPKKTNWKFDENLQPVSVDTMLAHYASVGQSSNRGNLNVVYKSLIEQIERPMRPLSNNNTLRALIRFTTAAFLQAFVAETGANSSIIPKLKQGDEATQPVTRGLKFSGLKARAGNKIVTPEFGATFLPWFRRYENFRKWVLKICEVEDYEYWFFIIAKSYSNDEIQINNDITRFEILQRQYKKFINNHFPELNWVSWQDLRLATSDNFLKASQSNIGLTAIKLSNTVQTVRDKYSHSSIEDATSEISSMFEALSASVIKKSRTTTDSIEVVVLNPSEAAIETMSGECTASSTDEPVRSAGFTEVVMEPHCAKAESCLFCEHYAIHADEKDIRKLLSIIFLIPSFLKASGTDTNFIETLAPLKNRAEEVLKQIKYLSEESMRLVTSVGESVAEGNLDPFWESHFDYLIEMNYL